LKAPLGHLTGRWRKHALDGETIAPNYYEAAAFETLKGRVRSGDVAVSGSRRYRSFENYLLPPAHFEQLTEKQQTRLAVEPDAEAYLEAKHRRLSRSSPRYKTVSGRWKVAWCWMKKDTFTFRRSKKQFQKKLSA
jgi:hypothetical protein